MVKGFENPSNQFRPIPFWSWNDKLDSKELSNQIKEMKHAGVGGYFMHARSGLKTEYLSEEWFDCIRTGIEAGGKNGLNAWIYDEEGWPSGFAGGIVPAMAEDFQAKFITIEEYDTDQDAEDAILALYYYNKEDKTFCRRSGNHDTDTVKSDSLLAVRKHINPFYIDTMNKRAVEMFLKVTHEEYYKRFAKEFGETMQGFFTDEPRLSCNNFGDLAWSDDLPDTFIKRHSYDIMDYLPALFFDSPGCEKYRYDFWETVNYMFSVNYMKTIYDWCESHNCKVTGHIMMEESIFSQMTSTAGVMPFYEYFHIPGIDWLRRMIASPVIAKQVGSVACQLGKKQVLTESFALCGWNVSFEELKWIAEWQFVNGVNQICQHLQAYTIKGSRKRDYPPSLFTQQTWWPEYKKFNDYLGRLCVALSDGDQTADVLLLHPLRSGYVCYDGTRTQAIRTLDEKFEEISSLLSGMHISYHFGDETIIEKYGSIQKDSFVVGRISYKTVVLPYMYAIDTKTLELLLHFINQGGTVISMGQLPYFTNGDPSRLEELCKQVTMMTEENLRTYLSEQERISLSIAQDGNEIRDISYLQKESKDYGLYFLVNHNQETTYHAKITVIGKQGEILRLKAEDGSEEQLSCQYVNGNTVIDLVFEPMQSYLLQFVEKKPMEYITHSDEIVTVSPGKAWNIEAMDLNSMTLDYCDYRIDHGAWQGKIPVIKLQNLLLDLRHPCEVELRFEFEITADLNKNKEFYTVIEDAQTYDIMVNDREVPVREEGWWKDKKFKKVTIKPYIKNGINVITLKTQFKQPQKVYDVLYNDNVYETEKNKITYDIEIENIYLLGDFGVVSKTLFKEAERNAMITDGEFQIVDAPVSFPNNDFTTNGLLFFAGALTVSQKLLLKKQSNQRIILDYGKQNAPYMKIYLNHNLIKDSLWAPYRADITDVVTEGENLLEIKLYASNRNLLGPHHHINGECYNVGPESFTGKWSWVERKSEADATEIKDRTKNYWTDRYSFVHFGLLR